MYLLICNTCLLHPELHEDIADIEEEQQYSLAGIYNLVVRDI